MMRWGLATISHFAHEAGFVRPDLHTAVALAHVCSGGWDAYDFTPSIAGCGRYVGLWAIDADRFPEYSPEALRDPRKAAVACYELTQRMGGFGWSAAWQRGAERRYLSLAAQAHGMLPFQDPPPTPNAQYAIHKHDAWAIDPAEGVHHHGR